MDIVKMIVTSPFLYIGLEVVAIFVLLYFVVKWTKLYKQWVRDEELAAEQAKETELLKLLANDRRKH